MGPQGLDFLHLLLLVELCTDLVQQGEVQTLHQVRVLQVASTICPGPRGSGWSGAMRRCGDASWWGFSFYWFCPGLPGRLHPSHWQELWNHRLTHCPCINHPRASLPSIWIVPLRLHRGFRIPQRLSPRTLTRWGEEKRRSVMARSRETETASFQGGDGPTVPTFRNNWKETYFYTWMVVGLYNSTSWNPQMTGKYISYYNLVSSHLPSK